MTPTQPTIHTDLARFSVGDYQAGPKWKVLLWYAINYLFFDTGLPWPYGFKANLLRWFGARVGKGLVIKPKARVKNPWRLVIGDHCWLGEAVWIDNLADVHIGSHVTLSQGALLLTGNHDYTVSSFPYRLGTITLEDGVWIGAQTVVCPGVTCASHSILTVGSVATRSLGAWGIHAGNPARFVRERVINS